jgi:Flp pilus assembly protein TadB
MRKDVEDILEKYKHKLDEKYGEGFSGEYKRFKKEQVGNKLSFFEKGCKFCKNLLAIKPSEKDKEKLWESITTTGMKVTPEGVMSFAFFGGFAFILLGVLIFFMALLFGNFVLFFPLFFVAIGVLGIRFLSDYPNQRAVKWRMESENQMVLCVLYIVMYMRHTSNLEHAVKFAAQHIQDPLSTDLKKVFWNIETGKYATMQESLDAYLETWRGYNLDFVNAFHLIESSLFEPKDERRLEILERALTTMLDGTYEKMLHYAQDLKGPVTTLYMLGIILPVLGLIMLPLIGGFVGIKWYWIAFFYNFLLPAFVYFTGNKLLIKRPAGEGESFSLQEGIFDRYKYLKIGKTLVNPAVLAVPLFVLILIIGLSPVWLHWLWPNSVLLNGDWFLGYRGGVGPFGFMALMLSLAIPLSFAMGFGTYYKLKSRNLVKVRENTRGLEKEFAGSLFQLGNRIEDGLPVELAFSKVAENMEGTMSGRFFNLVSNNLRGLGMGLREAIFNTKRGAILSFPSRVISSSMEVLIESARKGPKIVSHALMSISNYMAAIHKVNERLKDLLADVLSSMSSQINFLTPLIAGIVVGIGSLITNIIANLAPLLGGTTGGGNVDGFGIDVSILTEIFPVDAVIPPFFFQFIVGLYLVQITYILTVLANGIENGVDKLNEENSLGKNLYKSMLFYIIITIITTVILTLMARGVLNVGGGVV